MNRSAAPGWRFFTGFALVLVAAAWILPRVGVDGSAPAAHGVSAIVFLAIGGWALATTRGGRPMHALIAGLLLLGASGLSFLAAFLPQVVPPRLSWSLALGGAISAIALELVMAHYAEDLEELRGAGP